MHQPQDERYDITQDCDLECSEECLELREFEVDLKILDSCNAERCNCFYSQVSSDICTPQCKKSCLLVPGGIEEFNLCLDESCGCSSAIVSLVRDKEEREEKRRRKDRRRRDDDDEDDDDDDDHDDDDDDDDEEEDREERRERRERRERK